MRKQLPGAHRRPPKRGILKPQHRMVLGLVSMSAAALMLSLMYQKDPDAPPDVPRGSDNFGRPSAEVPVAAHTPNTGELASDEALSASVKAAGPALRQCVEAYAPDLAQWAGRTYTLELQLDSSGLARADIFALEGAPAPFLGCVGAGLGAVSWPVADGDEAVLVRVNMAIPTVPRVIPLGG